MSSITSKFHCLPSVLITEILRFLDQPCENAQLTCKEFQQHVPGPRCLDFRSLNGKLGQKAFVNAYIDKYQTVIRSLDTGSMEWRWTDKIYRLTALKKFALNASGLDAAGFNALSALPVEDLKIKISEMHRIDYIKKLPLRRLDLTIKFFSFGQVADLIGLPLESLTIEEPWAGSALCPFRKEEFHHWEQLPLKHLAFSTKSYTCQDFQSIQMLPLETLSIHSDTLKAEDILAFVSEMPTLKKVELNGRSLL
jgi:hypothetical protein